LVIDGVTIPTATLHPMGVMRVKLGELAPVGVGPKGNRMIRNVLSIELKSEKLNATLANVGAADWLNVNDDVAALDVRLTLKTDDGEFIHVEYQGRSDPTTGLIATAPTFQTGSEKYKWLNKVQAVAAGNVNVVTGDLVYHLYEVKVTI